MKARCFRTELAGSAVCIALVPELAGDLVAKTVDGHEAGYSLSSSV